MRLSSFRVRKFRNIVDSGPIDVHNLTAIVGQNEGGKSNLCEALYKLNPFDGESTYVIDEDWPADDWGGKDANAIVCEATFLVSDPKELKSLAEAVGLESAAGDLPTDAQIFVKKAYSGPLDIGTSLQDVEISNLSAWVTARLPKFVYVRDYELSGSQVELNNLAAREKSAGWSSLTNEEQTILIILKLASINIDEFVEKGVTPEGRTLRSFDKRQASAYLTQQFARLWKQKKVRFDIDVDATTLNIFVEDEGLGMPVRLSKRSTGFRWYVSFAWKFTHATKGDYRDCVLLLEEPGIHLHHAGHRDLLELFEELTAPANNNTIIYTTHLATMLDESHPERVRIVEVVDHHSRIVNGVVSEQKKPMMVIESRLGLTGAMSGLLGNRQTLVVEGGDDAVVLQKLSGLLIRSGREGLSDRIYLFPADGASKTPMYAGFLVGHGWDSAVLLDSDDEGEVARKKISQLYLKELANDSRFRVLMLGKASGIKKTDAAIEDLFPDDFYLDCVNKTYSLAISIEDLPVDGSSMITKRIEQVLQKRFGRKLDKGLLMNELLKRFDTWKDASGLPGETADRAEALCKAINRAFSATIS